METPLQEATRLLSALDELVDQEGMYLRGGYYDLAVETRDRADPLVRRLVQLDGPPELMVLRPQLEAVLAKSTVHATLLQQKMSELRAEIQRTEQARHRNAQMRPAYGRNPALAAPRFQAAG